MKGGAIRLFINSKGRRRSMTIDEVIGKAMVLLDEVTSSNLTANAADYINKIFPSIDTIQTEIATNVKPIEKYLTVESENKRIDQPADCFQMLKVYNEDFSPIRFLHYNKKIFLIDEKEDGTFTLYYNKYPTKITNDTARTTELEIDADCQEALVYGVAANLCINDEPELYDTYIDRYNIMLANITTRMQNNTTARIVGGIRI